MNHVEAGHLGYAKSRAALGAERERAAIAARTKYAAAAVRCGHCTTLISFKNRGQVFCNRACMVAAKRRAPTVAATNGMCRVCKATVAKRQVFCSACRPRPPLEELKSDRGRRLCLIRERGHACECCRNSEWCGRPIPIELDHINGDHLDNRAENLRLICPNCHALTPTYKNKNKGNGRPSRRFRLRSVDSDVPALYPGEADASAAAGFG